MSADAYLENSWAILRIHLGNKKEKEGTPTTTEEKPYWSFHLKESHGLDEPVGLFKCSLPVFKGRLKGQLWKIGLSQSTDLQVEEQVLTPDRYDPAKAGPLLNPLKKTLVISGVLPELGLVHVDVALSDKGPFLLLRLRCPFLRNMLDLRLDEFVLWEGDVSVSGTRLANQQPRVQRSSLFTPFFSYGVLALALALPLVLARPAYLMRKGAGPESSSGGDEDEQGASRSLLSGATLALLSLTVAFRRWWSRTSAQSTGSRAVFVNGWNAWSFTGAVSQGQNVPAPAMPDIFSKGFHNGAGMAEYDRPSKTICSEMFALLADRQRRSGVLLGFLSQHHHFGALTFDPEMTEVGAHCRCDGQHMVPGKSMLSDWFMVQLIPKLGDEPLATYMDIAADYNHSLVHNNTIKRGTDPSSVPVGWCSWYHFYDKISETALQENILMMSRLRDKLPLDLFQIDDGYQHAWGDWTTLDRAKFPTKSMRDMVNLIRAQGLRPGLWLAPVAADKHSKIAAEHPDWIIRQEITGWPSNSANCGKWFYGLDVTHPDVQKYIRETLSVVSHGSWSYDYLKLDFLYAAALKGVRKDKTINTAQALQIAMHLIRDSVGASTFVLGCGAPLGATIGFVNANRVSADAGPAWLPTFPLPDDKWNLPCGRNMVRNTINRMNMHGRWWINDPDCMLLRETTSFTMDELIGIATVKGMSGGSFIISDDLASVSAERIRLAQALLPVTGKAALAIDILEREMPQVLRLHLPAGPSGDSWVVVALCNWDDRKADSCSAWAPLLRPLLGQAEGGEDAVHRLHVHAFEFWFSKYDDHQAEICPHHHWDSILIPGLGLLRAPAIPPHSARLYALRLFAPDRPQYLGSNLHFTCGMEVSSFSWWEEERSGCRVVVVDLSVDAGNLITTTHYVWLSLPGAKELLPPSEGVKVSSAFSSAFVWKIGTPPGEGKKFRFRIEYTNTGDKLAPCPNPPSSATTRS